MAVQSDDLVVLGLGITGDVPPSGSLQPTALVDGNHIQYRTSAAKGLPWGGFYVFWRPHDPKLETCLARQLTKLPDRADDKTSRAFGEVSLHSPTGIRFLDEFPAAGVKEIALPSAPLEARFNAPVHRVVATIGFRGSRPTPAGAGEEGPSAAGPAKDADRLVPSLQQVGKAVASRAKVERGATTETATPQGKYPRDRKPPPARAMRMIARDGADIVAETLIAGRPGEVVQGEVAGDRIDSVEFRPVDEPRDAEPFAALIDLCWTGVAWALAGRWSKLRDYPGPIALPVAEATYPCAGKPATQAAAEAVAMARIRYDSPAHWAPKFADLHQVLVQLVAGGPGGGPMEGRKATFVDSAMAAIDPDGTPKLVDENLLELVTLAALDPTMAQILGLYVVDAQVPPGQAFDYVVLADHGNAFGGQAQAALQAATLGALPLGVDAWITFNHAAMPRPPLSLPAGPRAYVLPETAVSGDMSAPRGGVGLSWTPPVAAPGFSSADSPVRYILWRRDYGAAAPGAPAGPFVPLNANAPYLVGADEGAAAALMPANWPPAPLRAVERRLADGWYGFRLSIICLFGRHTPPGADGDWWQWATAVPKPWYYQPPAGDRQRHAFAVEIRDMLPPSAPAFVEATALDPADEDNYVRDAAYDAWWLAVEPWWNGLTDAERAAAVPLRVRWRWHPGQDLPNPPTTHFRLYFNPGSTPPGPDPKDPANWQDRIFVCDYNDHFTLVPATTAGGVTEGPYRQYEVLLPVLPPSGAPPFLGVPLQPGLAEPVVYANVAVTAANSKPFGTDHPKWAGHPWGELTGIEGKAASATIFRVWRTPPPAPASLNDNDRVLATKADYHGNSFWTVRWPTSPHLKAHVYAVLDSTLFMVERMNPAAATLAADDLAALHKVWPTIVPANVIAELTALRALKPGLDNGALPLGDPQRKANDTAWAAARAALGDGALRGLAALPLHEDSYMRQTVEPVDPPDAAAPDDPAGYAPNPAWRALTVSFDGRTVDNRYFLRAAYINDAHVEGEPSVPSPPIYFPPAVPPRTPVITKVTGGDRRATIAWTTVGAEAGGRYVLYRTDNDYELRDVRLMKEAARLDGSSLAVFDYQAEWSDYHVPGGRTWHYRLVFVDAQGEASSPSAPQAVFVPDETAPPSPIWAEEKWLIVPTGTDTLLPWPLDGVVPQGHTPVLQLAWETSTASPGFSLARGVADEPGWEMVARGPADQFAAEEGQQFTFVDWEADPNALLRYRIKAVNGAGIWSRNFAELSIAGPAAPQDAP
jgi:hypothetical protein